MSQISELEAAVLCVLRRTGGCTPYRVRMAVVKSPTSRFSGSAGSIYPLIRRMEKQGLVSTHADKTGKRTHRVAMTTAAGVGALRKWILTPDSRDFDIPFDPILTRVDMLANVSTNDARTFLEKTIEGLEVSLVETNAAIRERADANPRYGTHVGRCYTATLRARIKWLRALLSEIP